MGIFRYEKNDRKKIEGKKEKRKLTITILPCQRANRASQILLARQV